MHDPADDVVFIDKSISGAWWRMRYKGKVELTEEEPTEAQRKLFKQSVDTNIKYGDGSSYGQIKATIAQADR